MESYPLQSLLDVCLYRHRFANCFTRAHVHFFAKRFSTLLVKTPSLCKERALYIQIRSCFLEGVFLSGDVETEESQQNVNCVL